MEIDIRIEHVDTSANAYRCSEPFVRRGPFTRHLVERMRQAHSLDSLPSEWGKSRGYGPAHLGIRIFGRMWEPNCNGKQIARFDSSVE